MLEALIFDVDGTLADTEAAHRAAFNDAFAEVRLDWHWDDATYIRLLGVSGGKERIAHHWRMVEPDVAEGAAMQATVERVHAIKTRLYESRVSGGQLPLRPGVLRLMREALASGLRLAIATTTSPVNIAALLGRAIGRDWRTHFAAIGDASTAPVKKPHPQVYLQMLDALQLPAPACLAIEDSSNGLRAAVAAGIATVITPNGFTAHHDFAGALRVVPDLQQVHLAQLREWHRSLAPR